MAKSKSAKEKKSAKSEKKKDKSQLKASGATQKSDQVRALPADKIVSELMYADGLYWYETSCCDPNDLHTSVFVTSTQYQPAACGQNPPEVPVETIEDEMEARGTFEADSVVQWSDFCSESIGNRLVKSNLINRVSGVVLGNVSVRLGRGGNPVTLKIVMAAGTAGIYYLGFVTNEPASDGMSSRPRKSRRQHRPGRLHVVDLMMRPHGHGQPLNLDSVMLLV